MSYSPTYQVKNISSRNEESSATSMERVYQSKFIDIVYKEVIKAAKKRSKDDPFRFDLDSKEILINAQKLTDEQLRKGVLI